MPFSPRTCMAQEDGAAASKPGSSDATGSGHQSAASSPSGRVTRRSRAARTPSRRGPRPASLHQCGSLRGRMHGEAALSGHDAARTKRR
jgi:hypothetical protein